MSSIINHPLTFQEFLDLGGNIQKTKTGYLANFSNDGKLADYEFTQEQIANHHKDLPEVLNLMLAAQYGNMYSVRAYVQDLKNTLHHWLDPICVHDVFRHSHFIGEIKGVLLYDENSSVVNIFANCYKLTKAERLTYASDFYSRKLEISKSVLEEAYPGWLARYELMLGVAVNNEDLMRAVFKRDKDVVLASPIEHSIVSSLPDTFI